tara:strand:- start:992 stop:2917 length:1926 start_codon:yes stop_codon:yes gene_type:complete
MCGISGLIGWYGKDKEGLITIKKMISSLNHRGPDDSGLWVNHRKKIYFGHNRLSILDLSNSGSQPMTSLCERYVITFNGEIYNHLAIRQLIEKKRRIIWRGTSDTETLVEAISSLGLEKTLHLVRGMFAFCIFDNKDETISLVRDRLGEKPLYLLNVERKFYAFASEINAFTGIRNFKPKINLEALSCYFKRGWIAAPLSIWENVSKVLPGKIVKLKKNKHGNYYIYQTLSYWDCSKVSLEKQKNIFEGSFEKSVTSLEKLLLEVLEGQSLSDVPLGVFLSGGIDSSLIAALMQKSSRKKIKTFSIGFSDKNYDESFFAGKIATHLKTEHMKLEATPQDAINLIEKMPFVYSEPFADSSQIPTTLLCSLARQHVKVALTGDGGDEFFSGYTRYLFAQNSFRVLNKCPQQLRKYIVQILKMTSPNFINKLGEAFKIKRLGDKLHKAIQIIPLNSFEDFYETLTTYWPDNSIITNSCSEIYNFNNELDNIENMMLADQLYYLPNDILVKGDRASMSVGLETRAPLLDHKIAEFAWSLPRNFRIENNSGKRILKEILYRHVPQNLVDRPKQGFGMPVNDWLRGPLREWTEDLISIKNLPNDGLLNGDLVRKVWSEHLLGSRNWEYKLWPVLMWQQWQINSKIRI